MDRQLRQQLLELVALDETTRSRLAESGELFDGYHPAMAAVHADNAAALDKVIGRHGWPGRSLVGDDGADAAWLILQHAIAQPDLQRRCLPLIETAAASCEVPARHVAYLDDRIRCFEGRPQKYGTQFDWDDNGEMSPLPLLDEQRVDEYRARVGLNSLAERTREIRAETKGVQAPGNLAEWRSRQRAWAESVGW